MDILKLIVDTDIGSDIDDALCLAYLLQQPRCEIVGITTCSSEPEKRAEIVDSICQYVGREFPIFPGLGAPILGKQLQVAVHQYDVAEHITNDWRGSTPNSKEGPLHMSPIGPHCDVCQ